MILRARKISARSNKRATNPKIALNDDGLARLLPPLLATLRERGLQTVPLRPERL